MIIYEKTFSDMAEGAESKLGLHTWSEQLQERTIHFQVAIAFFPLLISKTKKLFSTCSRVCFPKICSLVQALRLEGQVIIWVGEEAVLGCLAMAVPVADCPSTQVNVDC